MNRTPLARATLRASTVAPQAASRVPLQLDEDARVVLGFLREAMDETKWTQEALAAWFKEHDVRSTDRQYIGKMLDGEKPITLRDVVALPDDLEGEFLRRWNARFGPSEQVVIANLLTAVGDVLRVCQLKTLPAKADRRAKASLPDRSL